MSELPAAAGISGGLGRNVNLSTIPLGRSFRMHLIIDLEANKVYFTPLMHLSPDGALLSVPKGPMSELTDDEQRLRHASVGVPARIFLVSLSPHADHGDRPIVAPVEVEPVDVGVEPFVVGSQGL